MHYKLRVGLGLDGLLTDTESQFRIWKERLQIEADSYLHPRMIRDESFWRSLVPYDDVREALRSLTMAPVEVYVLTERPPALVPMAGAWLRYHGLADVSVSHIIPQTIKRYDCRLLRVDVMLDSDLEMLKTYVYDETQPYYIDRVGNGGSLNGRIRNFDYMDEAIEHVYRANNLL